MKTKKFAIMAALFFAATMIDFASVKAATEPEFAPEMAEMEEEQAPSYVKRIVSGKVVDLSEPFFIHDLPAAITINPDTLEGGTSDMQPRLRYLRILGLTVGADGKTISFNIENSFQRKDAKPIRLGGVMLTGKVRLDYDNGAELHNTVLFKEKRIVLKTGANEFKTDPTTYANVTKIEQLQFYIMPPKTTIKRATPEGDVADTSQSFSVNNLPQVIVVDQETVDRNASERDPRLGYLTIKGLSVGADGKTVNFSIENNFNRRQSADPVHIGELMVAASARFMNDNGAKLHNCVLLSKKHVVLEKGVSQFTTDPKDYPQVAKLEELQFFLTPK